MKNDNFAASISASSVPPAATVPSDDEVDAAPTLRDLRAQEGAIMRATRGLRQAVAGRSRLWQAAGGFGRPLQAVASRRTLWQAGAWRHVAVGAS